MTRKAALLVALAAVSGLGARPVFDGHPNALWRVVHDLCVRDQRILHRPEPCLRVDLRGGVAVVPDPVSNTHVLVTPTRRISGIESPLLLAPGAPNYWKLAWDNRDVFVRRTGGRAGREDIAMTINSTVTRSQDQLHIHIDCVRDDVRRTLNANSRQIGRAWAPLRGPVAGLRFKARRLSESELAAGQDPFRLLAAAYPGAASQMGGRGLALVPTRFEDGTPGFYLLSGTDGAGFAEALQDHRCKILGLDRKTASAGLP